MQPLLFEAQENGKPATIAEAGHQIWHGCMWNGQAGPEAMRSHRLVFHQNHTLAEAYTSRKLPSVRTPKLA